MKSELFIVQLLKIKSSINGKICLNLPEHVSCKSSTRLSVNDLCMHSQAPKKKEEGATAAPKPAAPPTKKASSGKTKGGKAKGGATAGVGEPPDQPEPAIAVSCDDKCIDTYLRTYCITSTVCYIRSHNTLIYVAIIPYMCTCCSG